MQKYIKVYKSIDNCKAIWYNTNRKVETQDGCHNDTQTIL